MSQAWLQVVGLLLDMIGFGLILWEWVIAQHQEARLRAMEAAEGRQAESMRQLQRAPATTPQMQHHLEAAAESRQRLARLRKGEVGRQYRGVRFAVVYLGAACVLLGFLVQLLAAWPGCCTLIGIQPAG